MNFKNIEKMPVQALESLLAIDPKDKSRWLEKFLKKSALQINEDKKIYRAYGHYWWLLKSIFIKHGLLDFGINENTEFKEALSNNDDHLDAVACWLYQHERIEAGAAYDNQHTIDLIGDMTGDLIGNKTIEFTLIDDDVETLISQK